jgi:PKD repeat protein
MKNPYFFITGLLILLLGFYPNTKAASDSNDSSLKTQSIDLNVEYTGYLDNSNDVDWYEIHVAEYGILTIQDSTSSELDYDIRLYDEDSTTLIKQVRKYSDNSGGTISLGLSPGYYFIEFNRYSSDTYGDYTFTPEFTEVSNPGDPEPNDSIENSRAFTLNALNSGNLGHRKMGMYDDEDWYHLTVEKDGHLKIVDSTSQTLAYWVRLYDEDGQSLIKEVKRYNDNSGPRIALSLLPGEYHLQFEKSGSDYDTYGEYTFTPEFTEVSNPGDTEPNDSIEDAGLLKLDTLNSGNLGHRKMGMYDDVDWFGFTITRKGKFTLRDSTVSPLSYWIRLYQGDDQTLIMETRRYQDNSGSRLSTILKPDTYYVQFEKVGADYSTYGAYSFYPEFIEHPQADFEYVQNISRVSFSNTSVNGQDYHWDFDDGQVSTEVNPSHEFTEPGEYHVSLIASNLAGSDTAYRYITLIGIKQIVDNSGGNSGDVTIDIYGGGFTEESEVRLTRTGSQDILPDTVMYLKKGVLQARFDLRGAPTGAWNVEIETPGSNPIVQEDGFEITEGVAAEPWVEISGRSRALLGRWTTYTINYGNKGNVDASGVPLWLAMSDSPNTNIRFVDFQIAPPRYAKDSMLLARQLRDSIPLFFTTDSLWSEPFESKVYPLIIPVIPAGQSGQLTIRVRSDKDFRMTAWVNPPIFSSPMSQEMKDCIFWAQMKAIADGVIGIAGSALPLGCVNSVVTNYIYNPWEYKKPTDDEPKSIGSHMWTLASTVINCAGDLPFFKAYKLTVAILQFGAAVIDNSIADESCRDAFDNPSKTNMTVRAVTSLDPNEKAGPKGIADENYIRKSPLIDYTIYFENKDTAKAPAQEIRITDTLDTGVLDVQQFNFKSLTLADTTIELLAGLREFAVDIDRRPQMDIIVRATGRMDTTSGVISWLFKALNPETMSDNENPDLGVLLPNVDPPEGEGHVTFNVGVKPELKNNDVINNKATITFDFNEPIVTNQFVNTIDSEKPQSNILALPEEFSDAINLEIEGSDDGSGIDYYTIFVSVDDSAYVPLKNITDNQLTYTPRSGSNFRFYSVASDRLGNKENAPTSPDTETNMFVSVPSLTDKEEIIIWPNPVGSVVHIQTGEFGNQRIIIELMTIHGQQLIIKELNNNSNGICHVNLPNLNPGIYLLKLKWGDFQHMEKIIKF